MSSPRKSFRDSGLFRKIHDSVQNIQEHVQNTVQDARSNARDLSSTAAAFVEEKALDVKYVDLEIQFIGARDLPALDLHTNSSDPYFRAKLGPLCFVSSVKVETLNPVWNEPWRIMNVPSHATLAVEVFDKDDGVVVDDYIGKFETSVSPGAKEVEIIRFARSRGTFWLKVDSKPATTHNLTEHPYIFDGPIRFTRHFSPTVGRLTNLNNARLYSTWKMTLRAVPLFFGDVYQHWNRNYPAAQRIFQDRGSFAVRSGIIAGHKMLYARSTTNGFGTITDPARDTIRLLHSGPDNRRDASGGTSGGPFAARVKPAVYTYVIAADDDTFRFSETGAAFFVDFASKHALHSACNERVRYSGEFHPRPKGGWQNFSDETPDSAVPWELVIDNNSGTYAPDKTLLPKLQACLEYNFPGFVIVALDREDPALIESREACRTYATHRRGISADELEPHKHVEGEESLMHQAMETVDQQNETGPRGEGEVEGTNAIQAHAGGSDQENGNPGYRPSYYWH